MDTKSTGKEQVNISSNQDRAQVSLTLSISGKTTSLEIANAKISYIAGYRSGERFVQISISTDADTSELSEIMSSTKCSLTNE
jgi:hypothetical protein